MKKLNKMFTSLLCALMLVVTVGSPVPYASNADVNQNTSFLEQTLGNFNQVAYAKAKKKSPKLNKTSASLDKGKTVKLSVQNNSKAVKWSTSNKKVATVSNGKVTAKKAGTAKITAKLSDGKKLTCTIKVKNKASVDNTVVYITRTGHKYHRNGCRYLRQSKIKTTISKAKGSGCSACSVCY